MKLKRGVNTNFNLSFITKHFLTGTVFLLVLIMLLPSAQATFVIDKSKTTGINNHIGGSNGYARITLCDSTTPPLSLGIGAANNNNAGQNKFVEYLLCGNASSSQDITPLIDFNAPLVYVYAKSPKEDFFCGDGLRSDLAACGMGSTFDSSNAQSWLQTIVCCEVHDAYINYDPLKRTFLNFFSSASPQTKSCPDNSVVCGAKEDPIAIDLIVNNIQYTSSRVTGVYCCPIEQETGASCRQGTDRDNDTLLGCDDTDCKGFLGVNGEPCENQESYCNDGYDNDKDGFTDFEDKDCYDTAANKNNWSVSNGPITFNNALDGDKKPTASSPLFVFNPSSTTSYDGVCGDDAACVPKQTIASCSDITDQTTCESNGCTYTAIPPTTGSCAGGDFCAITCAEIGNPQGCQGCDLYVTCEDMDESDCNYYSPDCTWTPPTTSTSSCTGTLTPSTPCGSLSKNECIANNNCTLSPQTDLYFFDVTSKFFCSNDYDNINAEITNPPADWRWWNAMSDDAFIIHKIII